MKHFDKIIKLAIFTVLMMIFISHSGTNAQGLNNTDGIDLPSGGSEVKPPPGETLETEPPVLAPVDAASLVSSSFTYQGLLKNGGAAVNNQCDFIWNLFAGASGGTSLATDTESNVQLTNGLFTVVIDVPANVIDGNARYAEIQVRCPTGTGDYTTLTPRQELEAAPYALGLRLPFHHSVNTVSDNIFAINNTSTSTTYPTILGGSAGNDGVRGLSTGGAYADNGVYGETNSTDNSEAGVKGFSTDAAAGGYFTSISGNGVYGSTGSETRFGGYFNNTATPTSGGALYANGDAKQSLAGDGFVKAGAYIWECGNSASEVGRSFNNVNTTAISVTNGIGLGRCTVDFGFDVSSRYISALSWDNGARIVTFQLVSGDNHLVNLYRYDQAGAGVNGGIMVLIY